MGEESGVAQLSGNQGLDQFILLARTTKGAAAAQLIEEATSSPGLYVFGELLESECLQNLSETEYAPHLKLLEIYTFGTYTDYKSNAGTLPQLSHTQLNKLKHLTILTIAAKCKMIPYSLLLTELDIPNVRELEDLIIDAIYHNILQAKLDQSNHQLEVECFIGRDTRIDQLGGMIDKLEQWSTNCAAVVQLMENQITRANQLKTDKTKQKESLDQEIKSLKQAVSLASKDSDQNTEYQESGHKLVQMAKKGLRGSLARNKS